MPERMPLLKLLDTPFISLDESNVEMASILFLFVVVFAVARLKRHRQLARHLVQFISIFFFFFIVYSCLGVFGLLRNGLYGLTLLGTAYTESFYWVALPGVVAASTLVAGPLFCGWICPTGTIQELAAWVRERLRVITAPRPWVARALLGLAAAGFVAAVVAINIRQDLFIEDSSLYWGGGLLLLCYLVLLGYIDDVPSRRLKLVSVVVIVASSVAHLTITSPVHFAFTARDDPASALTTLVIFVASLVVARSWCRYLCPWGHVMGFLHRYSRLKVTRLSGCVSCGSCNRTCDVAAIENGLVRHQDCQLCYACVDRCPNGALEVVDVWRQKSEGSDGGAP